MDERVCRSTRIGVNPVVMNSVINRQWMIDINQKNKLVQSVKSLDKLFYGWVLLRLGLLDLVFMKMITRKNEKKFEKSEINLDFAIPKMV